MNKFLVLKLPLQMQVTYLFLSLEVFPEKNPLFSLGFPMFSFKSVINFPDVYYVFSDVFPMLP